MLLFAYQDNTKEIFKQIPTEKTTPTLEYFKRKCQTIQTDIGGECYLENMHNYKPPAQTKKTRLIKNYNELEDKPKVKFKILCEHWKYWRFRIHCKIEICHST